MSATRRVTLLGSTGSIGTQALSVIEAHPERFKVVALAAGGSRPDLLAQQAVQFRPEVVAVPDDLSAAAVRRSLQLLGADVPVLVGPGSAASVASRPCDVVLNGMTGAVGLPATLAALRSGATLALANKESLIIGGPLVKALAAPGQIVPVDSEHSALAQCLASGERQDVCRLVLTASGGPFRGRRRAELADVTPDEAMAHPTWAMGPVITINSATLVNKGLEVIEAHLLFDVPMDAIEVVVHPQSVIHSMVEFVDGSTIAQASPPDMRLPIAQGLAWPQRVPDAVPAVDWRVEQAWTFQPLDEATFPAVALARAAGSVGGTAPAVYNAVNETAVAAFRERRSGFLDIVGLIERVLAEHVPVVGPDFTLDAVTDADAWARERAEEMISGGDAHAPGSVLARATEGDAGVRT